MEHKCDLCEKPAQVHEVLIKNGQKHEIHLCPECASAQGYGGAAGQLPAKIAKKLPAKPLKRRVVSTTADLNLNLDLR